MATEFVVIACDESGNEGENLTRAGSRVFAHASVSITSTEADDIIGELREATGSKSAELKSSLLLQHANSALLEGLLTDPRLDRKANVHLTDKRYFVSGKIIDLVVETLMFERGHNLYHWGRARDMALILYRDGAAQLGQGWETALDQFNTMLRLKVRSGGPKGTLDEFYGTLDDLRPRATGKLSMILRLVHAGRDEAASLINNLDETSQNYLSLDPLFAAIGQIARTWYEREGLAVRLVHDETSLLTNPRIETLKSGLSGPGVASLGIPPVPLQEVLLVDSKNDARVQVADLLAGAGRVIADVALDGDTHPMTAQMRPHVDLYGIWGDDASWLKLTGAKLTD